MCWIHQANTRFVVLFSRSWRKWIIIVFQSDSGMKCISLFLNLQTATFVSEAVFATSKSKYVVPFLLKLFHFSRLRFRSNYNRFRNQPLQFRNSETGCSTPCWESDWKTIIPGRDYIQSILTTLREEVKKLIADEGKIETWAIKKINKSDRHSSLLIKFSYLSSKY